MKEKEVIEKTSKELLKLLGFPEAKLEIQKEEEHFLVNIQVEDQGILIGYHGETINALQLILSLMVYRKLGKWQPLLIDIGEYRKEREEKLKDLALNTAQKVKFSQSPVVLSGLKPFERRIIHLVLADHPDVYTDSQGEEPTRELVIHPAPPKSHGRKSRTKILVRGKSVDEG